ncbi:hypothetical protein HQ45_09450 [Porphyromonas crevioricanis]|uniref:hypothetical protein n=1 Tax=Porphyromonas crevioricanis TaxID=393921 RepID=UPI00052DE61F|nr:hypothetical protein [Porphyromonas crevioricanis]KGN88881.1 hypothetical protein HQ45_09450 [Porphyromonas crevioricanis]
MYRIIEQTIGQFAKAVFPATCLLAGLLVCASLSAQSNSSESPYTRFGLGRFDPSGHASNRGMGGLGIGIRDARAVNPMNPASYSAVDSLTFIFDLGASAGFYWAKEGSHSSTRKLGNFEYATMLFPVTKYAGVSLGILPLATAGYQYGSVQPIEGLDKQNYTRIYQGTGNLNNLYIGAAIEPIEGLSVGANFSYLFGTYNHSRRVSYSVGTALDPTISSRLELDALRGKIGLQYAWQLANRRRIVFGATYDTSVKFKSKLFTEQFLISNQQIVEHLHGDTVRGTGLYTAPEMYGLGVSVDFSPRLIAGVDLQYGRWSDASFYKSQCEYQDQWRIAIGGQYIPNAEEIHSTKQLRYRAGLSLGNSYLKLPTTKGSEGYHQLGLSAGIAFPLVDRRSFVQMSLEYDRLIPTNKDMISEHSLRLTLGLTFNEGWFRKLKLN